MIIKKSQQIGIGAVETEVPEQRSNLKIGKRYNPPLTAETADQEETKVTGYATEARVRVSVDIEHRAYINLKCYASIKRKPIVTIIQDLIYTLPVKVSA